MTAVLSSQKRHALPPTLMVWLAVLVCFFCAFAEGLVWPNASGDTVLKKSGTTIDMSHAADGYIMVKQDAGKKRYKLRIAANDQTYTYDLNSNGEFEVFPLQLGVGTYNVRVYRQQSGNQYSQVSSQNVTVDAFNRDNACFLCPNQYVSYTADSAAVAASAEVCAELTDDAAKVQSLYDYILRHVNYDYILALTVEKGYLPDPDAVLSGGMGICFDYASLFACMLRVQGIPAQLVIGYADDGYHAWNMVLVGGEWQRWDLTAKACNMKILTYTTERYY